MTSLFVDIDKEHVEAIRANGLQVDVPDGAFNVKVNIVFPQRDKGQVRYRLHRRAFELYS